MVDLDVHREALPGYIVAVPMYVRDRRVIAFGNPSWEELRAHLRAALG